MLSKKILSFIFFLLSIVFIAEQASAAQETVYRTKEYCEFEPYAVDANDECKFYCREGDKFTVEKKKNQSLCRQKDKDAKKAGNKYKFLKITCKCIKYI